MYQSTYNISKMDCPSEENLIRIKLDGLDFVKKLEFYIETRTLIVLHSEKSPEISNRLNELNLGSEHKETVEVNIELHSDSDSVPRKLLWSVLIINFSFFAIEIGAGLLSNSMGLVADSLDMLADAVVYGLSLWAVGAIGARKKKVATLSGYFQMFLAVLGLVEIVRRFFGFEAVPDFRIMIGVSMLALIANSICLVLLQKYRSQEAHMRASMIFTSNDVIINAGVILAGVLVLLTNSNIPDLIVGTVVFLIVVRGAVRILELGK